MGQYVSCNPIVMCLRVTSLSNNMGGLIKMKSVSELCIF